MMDPTENAYGVDRELLREQLLSAVLKGQLALVRGDDEAVSAYLGELAVALADDTEVVRLDASQSHSASALVQALARALDVEADGLLEVLTRRGEALPLTLVIDNGECLGSRALTLLRNLLAKSGGGLGVLVGGEPDLPDLLAQAGITPACEGTAQPNNAAEEETPPGEPEADPAKAPGWREMLPWKHLAAVVGLGLLIWIFWPAEENEQGDSASSELELPPPGKKTGSGPTEAAAEQRPSPSGGERTKPQPGSEPSSASGPETDDTAASPGPDSDPGTAEDTRAAEPAESSPAGPETGGGPDEGDDEPDGLDAELAYRSEDWLLTRSPQNWMLQLALAADEQRARDLLDRLGRDRGAYYRARREGEVAYIVLAGPFGSRGQALGARSSLPDYFRERGPFPRRVQAIAGEIRALAGSGGNGS